MIKQDALREAREFETAYLPFITDEERPAFHLTGGIGWINDPNGFAPYGGAYHLFYQYHPYANHWGPMHWGHAKTTDFIRWERLPVALAPDTKADRDGCFSGSALELADGRHLLVYTGVRRKRLKDGESVDSQAQCVAFGDGTEYVKYEGNPVLDEADLPEGGSGRDFRDPKVWMEEDGTLCMVVGNRASDGSGRILLYESRDALHWSFVTILDASENVYGRMWECPDFFPLGEKQILMVSPQEMQPMGMEFHAGDNTAWLIGSYDRATRKFTREHVQAIDHGIDFYAPQTLLTKDGRRVMIAWMQSWASSRSVPQGARFTGEMTLPRELTMKDGRILQRPVRELEAYRGKRVLYENIPVEGGMTLAGIEGRILDMTVTVRQAVTGNPFRYFKIHLAKDGAFMTTIRYKPETETIRVDRSRSGFPYDIVNVRDFLVRPVDGCVRLRIILDKHSLELFVGEGEQAATFMIHTPQDARAISFESEGAAALIDVEKYELIIPQEERKENNV
ncbi:MAG: glycoside hydrolase family 32 protein [Lachnospiraceae bacterium]|nr:glycoside hydrolase family 32 protein [Lachnospiraceae bacterium]